MLRRSVLCLALALLVFAVAALPAPVAAMSSGALPCIPARVTPNRRLKAMLQSWNRPCRVSEYKGSGMASMRILRKESWSLTRSWMRRRWMMLVTSSTRMNTRLNRLIMMVQKSPLSMV